MSSLIGNHARRIRPVKNWIPPKAGGFKMNFDGASKGNLGKASFGYVIRDHDHNVIKAIVGPWECVMPFKLKQIAF